MSVSIQEILTQALGFLILVFVMRKMFWKPILASLESRRSKIKTDLAHIDETKKEVENLKVEYTAHIKKIDEAAREKLQEALDEGRKIAREIQDKARTESQAAFDKAKENLEIETAKARLSLRREIANLAIGVSERVLKEKMTDAKQQEKAQEIIAELEKSL